MNGEPDTSVPRQPEAVGEHDAASRGLDEATVISPAAIPGDAVSSSAEIGRRLVGTTLGPYRLEQFIGGGGMGAVFRGHDTTLDRVVAIKVLAGRQSDDEEMLRRFRNEAQSAARLDHGNIGRVYAVGSEQGWHYIVLEFIEGRNLRDLVRDEGPFDLARTVDVAVQVADALEHASQRAVVHRDIKPSNIVITPDGRARIVDMGLARLHQMAGERDLTMSGMTLGTFDYISPEQARDPRVADVRSDLYSLGCTIFYMLAGRPPFAEGTMVQKLLQHQQEPPPAIESLRPDVPRRFAAIVERLMAKDPAARPPRPALLVAELLDFADAEGLTLAVPRPVVTEAVPSPARRSAALAPWIVPLASLAALVAWLWIDALRPRPVPVEIPPAESAAASGLATPRIVRIAAPFEPAAVTEALAAAADGDVVELAFSDVVDVPGFAVAGRRLSLRAGPGTRPGLRFVTTVAAAGGIAAACDIGAGSLEVRGVAIECADPSSAPGGQRALFLLGSGTLACEDVLLEMAVGGGELTLDESPGRAAFVAVRSAGTADAGSATAVTLKATRASGDAVFLDATDGRPDRIALSWSGGGLITSRQLLLAAGTAADGGREVDVTLEDGTFACPEGVVLAVDSQLQPRLARLRVTARGCTFLTAGVPFVVQSGIGDPIDYEAALTWQDQGSRHEGTDVFRRIDGAAERIDALFRDQPRAVLHADRVDVWPESADWRSGWWGRSD